MSDSCSGSLVFRVIAIGLGAKEASEHTKGGAPAGSAIGHVPCQELDSLLSSADETCEWLRAP